MKNIKNIIILFILVIMMLSLTACDSNIKNENTQSTLDYLSRDKSNSSKASETEVSKFLSDLKSLSSEKILENAEKQMSEPNDGDTIAIMHVEGYGDIKIKFFESVAPKACENFITHAKEGYYDGLTFHRIINEFMIQGGDPLGNGTGGESIWNEDFGEELDATILPYRGSLSMASRGTGTVSIGSQFFINQTHPSDNVISELANLEYTNLNEACKLYGGELFMLAVYYQYTTFGQVFEGMDIVDKIASVEVDSNNKPLQDVIISSIEITTYKK